MLKNKLLPGQDSLCVNWVCQTAPHLRSTARFALVHSRLPLTVSWSPSLRTEDPKTEVRFVASQLELILSRSSGPRQGTRLVQLRDLLEAEQLDVLLLKRFASPQSISQDTRQLFILTQKISLKPLVWSDQVSIEKSQSDTPEQCWISRTSKLWSSWSRQSLTPFWLRRFCELQSSWQVALPPSQLRGPVGIILVRDFNSKFPR